MMLQGRIYGLPKEALKERVNELLTVFHLQEAADLLEQTLLWRMKESWTSQWGLFIARTKAAFS